VSHTLCGGPSGPKPGVFGIVTVGAPEVAALLELAGHTTWGAAVAALIAPAIFEVNTLCSQDPPPDPGITINDIASALNFQDVAISIPAINRLRQWFESQYWYTLCQCNAVPTPAPPAPSSPGPIGTNTGLPSGSPTAPCWDRVDSWSFTNDGTGFTEVNSHWIPAFIPAFTAPAIGTLIPAGPAFAVPTGVTTYTSTFTANASGLGMIFDMLTYNSAHAILTNQSLGAASAGQTKGPFTFTLPTGTAFWRVVKEIGTAGFTDSCNTELSFFCGGTSPTGLATPCCPPDPLVDQKLTQIISLVTSIYESLPVALTSYAESTIHSGLSGVGSVLVAPKTLAVKLILTTLPSWVGRTSGNPPKLFDAGFLTAVGSEGPTATQRIDYAQQVMVMPLLTTSVDYTLESGVVASVTELVRGP
jgi:hypothetical protein